jgi:hypothetical protein
MEMGREETESFNLDRYVPAKYSEPVSCSLRTAAHSEIAQAKPNPSLVEVPLPNSSMIISECWVAD